MLFRELAVIPAEGDLLLCWQAFINALVKISDDV
jgi:hypothetical protein